jgi:hypothetical protein
MIVVRAARLDLLADDGDAQRRVAHRVERHARARLAPPFQIARLGQMAQRTVHRGARAAHLARQIDLVGNQVARCPVPAADTGKHLVGHRPPGCERLSHAQSASRRRRSVAA